MSDETQRQDTVNTDKLVADVHRARRTDRRQKWLLFGLFLMALISLAISGALLIQSWAETGQSRKAAASEQIEKQDIAAEAKQVICESGDTEIFDADLCARLQAVAEEPPRGEAGPRGPSGNDGEPGPVGPRGATGDIGPRGMDGSDGLPGETGPVGTPGTDGTNGLDGIAGSDGISGVDGLDGFNGADGLNGEPGPAGEPGEIGPRGEPGADGMDGSQGPTGAPGPAGPPGADSTVPGPAGPSGATGTTGAQGISIADVECVGEGRDSSWQITLSDGTVLNGGGPCRVQQGTITIP